MTPLRHPTAFIDPQADVDPTVLIGPYCMIGPDVKIGPGTKLYSQVVVEGHTTIGARNVIYPGTCMGFPPQAKPAVKGSRLVVGDENIIREHVTMHTGLKENGTVVGNRNFFMAGSHVGHDCTVADEVTLANGTALGGHVVVEEKVMIGGLCGIHQYVRIGKYAMVGGLTKTTQDVLPFTLVDGRPARLSGVNLVGLRRNKFSQKAIGDIRRAIRLLHYSGAKFREAMAGLRSEFAGNADVEYLIRFIEASKRGVVRRGNDHPGAEAP
jgi:UDP-N-acetylglucosamine acyltransferase